MNKIKILSIILTILALHSGAHAMIISLSLEQLVQKSDLILIATVDDIAEVSSDAQRANIKNVLLPERILKGDWKMADQVTVMTTKPAGEVGWVEDQIEFPPVGNKVVVFLEVNSDGSMTPVNTIQGVWPIDPEIGDYLKMGFGISEEQLLTAIAAQ